MRAIAILLVLTVIGSARGEDVAAGRLTAPRSVVLVKTFTAKDMPANEPGKSAWEQANANKWSSDIAVCGQSVYAVSAPSRRLVRFQCDPATATVTFKGSLPIEAKDKESGGATLHVRQLPDGNPLLYVAFSTHHESSLLCYAVDKNSGALTLKGKADLTIFPNGEAGGGYGYPVLVWSPDQRRLYYVGVKKIFCYTFKDDGIPVKEGKAIPCANPGSNKVRGRGHAVFSADGRQLYVLTEKMVPAGKVFQQADTYDCDPQTGSLAFRAALDLPTLPADCCEFLAFSPDGKLLFVVDTNASCYHTLARDAAKGTLSILASGKPDAGMRGIGGPPWSRGGKFAVSADGRTGYYLGDRAFGSLAIDPATGVLSDSSSVAGMWTHLAFDPIHGNLFLVGGQGVSVFKTAAKGRAAGTK